MPFEEINEFVTNHFTNWGTVIQIFLSYYVFLIFAITLIFTIQSLKAEKLKRDIEYEKLKTAQQLNEYYLKLLVRKESEPEQQKILNKIAIIEKENRRRAIIPHFVIKYQGGLQTVWVKNIGEQARKIKVFLEMNDRNLKPINTYSPKTHIEKDGILKINLSVIPDDFRLTINFEDMEAIMKYSQYIYLEKRKFKISDVSWLYIEE